MHRFLRKPWESLDLRIIIRLALRHLEVERENRHLLTMVHEQRRALQLLARRNSGSSALRRTSGGDIVISPEEEAEAEAMVLPLAAQAGA